MVNYARHFGLLALLSFTLAIGRSRTGLGLGADFALYGALHAASLVLSLRASAGCAPGRRLLFVAMAAMLAGSNGRLGLFGLHAASGAGGSFGLFLVVALCAALGALAYGVLIRMVLKLTFVDPPSLAAISCGCAAAALASVAVSRALHGAGVLWLVIPWWFGFSGLLRYAERRRVA